MCFDSNIEDNIEIEVKASVLDNEELFTFYVSKNEWNKSIVYGESYFFYCLVGVSGKKENVKGPFIIPGFKLGPFIPKDEGKNCEWMVSRFILNLKLVSL